MTLTLLPCPFCGSQPRSDWCGDEDGGYWAVECIKCPDTMDVNYFCGVHADDQVKAEAAWNRRASLAPEGKPVADEPVAWCKSSEFEDAKRKLAERLRARAKG